MFNKVSTVGWLVLVNTVILVFIIVKMNRKEEVVITETETTE